LAHRAAQQVHSVAACPFGSTSAVLAQIRMASQPAHVHPRKKLATPMGAAAVASVDGYDPGQKVKWNEN